MVDFVLSHNIPQLTLAAYFCLNEYNQFDPKHTNTGTLGTEECLRVMSTIDHSYNNASQQIQWIL